MKSKNVAAKALSLKQYRNKVVKSKKAYNRKRHGGEAKVNEASCS